VIQRPQPSEVGLFVVHRVSCKFGFRGAGRRPGLIHAQTSLSVSCSDRNEYRGCPGVRRWTPAGRPPPLPPRSRPPPPPPPRSPAWMSRGWSASSSCCTRVGTGECYPPRINSHVEPSFDVGQGESLVHPDYIRVDASLSTTGSRAKAWCLRMHAEASLSLYLCPPRHRHVLSIFASSSSSAPPGTEGLINNARHVIKHALHPRCLH